MTRNFTTMWHLDFTLHLCLIFLLHFYDVCNACRRAEYRTGEECCPMCAPGSRVYKHCTEYTSTSCVPCVGDTFINQPNGLLMCFPCTVCDPGLGLKVVEKCTPQSDAVCGPTEEYFCIDFNGGGCRSAQKKTKCLPGQFIKLHGTASADTVCGDCPTDSYSGGSFTSCKPHTDCESKGLETVTIGNRTSDSECGEKNVAIGVPLLIGGAVLAVVVVVLLAVVVVVIVTKQKESRFRLAR